MDIGLKEKKSAKGDRVTIRLLKINDLLDEQYQEIQYLKDRNKKLKRVQLQLEVIKKKGSQRANKSRILAARDNLLDSDLSEFDDIHRKLKKAQKKLRKAISLANKQLRKRKTKPELRDKLVSQKERLEKASQTVISLTTLATMIEKEYYGMGRVIRELSSKRQFVENDADILGDDYDLR